jgi:two-component system response regulator CpxR
LLIEADEPYRAAIAACIRLAGCRVEQVADIESSFETLERHSFDVMVWGVSPADGDRRVEVMGELRLRSEAPLIVVDADTSTAQSDLEGGADQWLPKPFVPGALVGSIRASLRKSASSAVRVSSRLEIRGMVLDGGRRRLTYADSEVSFTRQEWDLLSILISHPIASSAPRRSSVWGGEPANTRRSSCGPTFIVCGTSWSRSICPASC